MKVRWEGSSEGMSEESEGVRGRWLRIKKISRGRGTYKAKTLK